MIHPSDHLPLISDLMISEVDVSSNEVGKAMDVKIVNVHKYAGGLEKAAQYFHEKWGSKDNYPFYLDAITHSQDATPGLPRFYLMLRGSEIIGAYALLTNDFISRHDLMPWLACLFIEESERGQRLSQRIFDHAKVEVEGLGYSTIYLATDHNGFYDKFGWTRIEDGYDHCGGKTKIYKMIVG